MLSYGEHVRLCHTSRALSCSLLLDNIQSRLSTSLVPVDFRTISVENSYIHFRTHFEKRPACQCVAALENARAVFVVFGYPEDFVLGKILNFFYAIYSEPVRKLTPWAQTWFFPGMYLIVCTRTSVHLMSSV